MIKRRRPSRAWQRPPRKRRRPLQKLPRVPPQRRHLRPPRRRSRPPLRRRPRSLHVQPPRQRRSSLLVLSPLNNRRLNNPNGRRLHSRCPNSPFRCTPAIQQIPMDFRGTLSSRIQWRAIPAADSIRSPATHKPLAIIQRRTIRKVIRPNKCRDKCLGSRSAIPVRMAPLRTGAKCGCRRPAHNQGRAHPNACSTRAARSSAATAEQSGRRRRAATVASTTHGRSARAAAARSAAAASRPEGAQTAPAKDLPLMDQLPPVK